MKKVLLVLGMFVLVGVGVGALWHFKVPPFSRPAKKATVAKKSPDAGAQSAAPQTAATAPTSAPPTPPVDNEALQITPESTGKTLTVESDPASGGSPAATFTSEKDPSKQDSPDSPGKGATSASSTSSNLPTTRPDAPTPNTEHRTPNTRHPTAPLSEPDLTRLAQVYEQMPVAEATRIMSKLPDTLVEPLLRRMDEKQVGKLLVSFAPDRSARLTLSMSKSSGVGD